MQIFLSYRRKDDSHLSGRLREQLAARYGAEAVFLDVESIPAGGDLHAVIRESIARSDVVLAIIGPRWNWLLRLHRRRDWIRLEIEEALARNRHVIPVLVDGRPMPWRDYLPRTLQPVSNLNALRIRAEPDFKADFRALVDCIDGLTSKVDDAVEDGTIPFVDVPRYADTSAERHGRRRLTAIGAVAAVGAAVVLAANTFVPRGARTDVLSTTIAPSTSTPTVGPTTAAPGTTTTSTEPVTTTVLVLSLRADQDPSVVTCGDNQIELHGSGAQAGEPVELAYGQAASRDLVPYAMTTADSAGGFSIPFLCNPQSDVSAWTVAFSGQVSGRSGKFTVVRAGSSAASSTSPASGTAPKPVTTVASTPITTASTVSQTTVKVIPATTASTTATTLRPPT